MVHFLLAWTNLQAEGFAQMMLDIFPAAWGAYVVGVWFEMSF